MANTQFEFWLEKVNVELKQKWEEPNSRGEVTSLPYPPMTYTKGRKFIKILKDTSVWGFIAMFDGLHKNSPVSRGDLLLPANWRSPAKHHRGNIFSGSAAYSQYGPMYIK